jgi:uncharacterized repeat protein (TIGR04138 family)
MLCEQCQERPATIHLTGIIGDKMTKHDLCEVCGQEHGFPGSADLAEQSPAWEALMVSPKYPRDASVPCEQCHERPARVRICRAMEGKTAEMNLCKVCAREHMDIIKTIALEKFAVSTEEMRLTFILANDPCYARESYLFVREGLTRAQEMLSKSGTIEHVSGTQLLEALRVLAIEKFGKQAKATLNDWGIHECEDFGEIVFNLIEAGLLAKQKDDTKAEFQGGYDFDQAFPTS